MVIYVVLTNVTYVLSLYSAELFFPLYLKSRLFDICPSLLKYENVCLFVCLFVHIFLGLIKTDVDAIWQKVAFYSWEVSKHFLISAELLPLFYISLIFLCKF